MSYITQPHLRPALLILGLVLVPSFGQGADRSPVALVQIRLIEAQIMAGLYDAYLSQPPVIDSAKNGEVKWIPVQLEEGQNYKIMGVCDDRCSDLDLILYDESNGVVAVDVRDDNKPWLVVLPQWTGEFLIKLVMADCREQSSGCTYGIGIFIDERKNQDSRVIDGIRNSYSDLSSFGVGAGRATEQR